MKTVEIVTAIACEDVRFEGDGRPMLIGLYSPEFRLKKFPCKISFWAIPIFNVSGAGRESFEFKIKNSEGDTLAKSKGMLVVDQAGTGALAPIGPFKLKIEGVTTIELIAIQDDRAEVVQSWRFTQQEDDEDSENEDVADVGAE
ncbi:hypothetical protein [uncultured Caulobacter sp.]|uniref:hypothetical protein n=1 Tax=uncultured Caulobacter sp. TaxID=158749 RepID=UPI0026316DB7|nr:hypothetical protein [uncultured Caulobacter sp.]